MLFQHNFSLNEICVYYEDFFRFSFMYYFSCVCADSEEIFFIIRVYIEHIRVCTANNSFHSLHRNCTIKCSAAVAMRERVNDYDLHLALVRQSLGRAVDCLSALFHGVCDTHDDVFQFFV